MSMRHRRLTTVVRLFDLRLPSNRFVLIGSALALVGIATGRLVTGAPPGDATRAGVEAALAFLLSWALARELHPDDAVAASLAAPLGIAIGATGAPNLGAITALLFAVRVASGTTGVPPAPLDLVWLPLLAAYSARSPGGFVMGVALAISLGATAGRQAWRWTSGALALVLALGAAVARDTLAPAPVLPTAWQWGVLAVALVAVLGSRVAPVTSRDDRGEGLSRQRVRWARGLAAASGLLVAAWIGGAAAPALAPLWAAAIGIGLRRASAGMSASRPARGPRRRSP